ncbi:hypothetical protein E2562_020974 [Oryza meyeriana var. granulata]|uniref:DUF1618 domain-containing protein n=1 Tax=Oryza meyeriana var. granulata TaxID=110450 RepID=A0A6G1E0Z7_9ORYZ|nr:hypothetical protein E2562_020974 [Oryza meyeriana var. granulata]
MAPPPSSTTSWVILSREVRACGDGDGDRGGLVVPEGADLSLDLAVPPRVAALAVSPRVSQAEVDPCARRKSPCVLAIDPSAGLVLLLAPPPPAPADAGRLRSWTDADGKVHMFRVSTIPGPRYFVCDVAARTASHVPDPEGLIFNNDLGVIAAPGGGGNYMVVEYQFIVGGGKATFLCFSSETGVWEKKDVDNPLPRWIWRFCDVVSHGGKLCWVDTAAGLLFCDPFADETDMEYVPLPEGDLAPGHEGGCGYCSERALATRRCVQLSDGKFRCVEMGCASDGAAPKVSMRTLVDLETGVWTLEYAVSFADIWASESYKATKLPEKAPSLALVHPKNPDVLYFFLEDQLFGVDLREKEVVEYEAHKMTLPENARVFSHCVLPMELPPALSAGLFREGAASGVNGVTSASPTSPPSDPNGA